MSYRHLALCAVLSAAIAVPSFAQAPATTDSATATDSTGKKPKKSRFGGIANRAKAVANNKTVQSVANNKAVQSAAKNVGCTVVPGAAVASAVTGQGPCANAGITGALMSATGGGAAPGGVKGAVTGAVTGAAMGAMGGKASSLMGMGGIGNAGAIQEMMRKSGALNGMSNAASAALVQQMMIQSAASGVSGAASTAAMTEMMRKSGALKGMSNAQTTLLMQQLMAQSAAVNNAGGADAAAAMQLMMQQAGNSGAALNSNSKGKKTAAPVVNVPPSASAAMYAAIMADGHVATPGIAFEPNGDQLRLESAPALQLIATMLTENPKLKLRIESHTDNIGVKETNRALSEKRAASIKNSLIKQFGVAANRLDAKGFGDTKPIGDNATPEGRNANFRIELVKM